MTVVKSVQEEQRDDLKRQPEVRIKRRRLYESCGKILRSVSPVKRQARSAKEEEKHLSFPPAGFAFLRSSAQASDQSKRDPNKRLSM